MASAIRVGTSGRWNDEKITMAESEDAIFCATYMGSSASSTVFSTVFSEPCASSGTIKKTYQRRRPPQIKKRKVETKVGDLLVSAKSKTLKVIPREGFVQQTNF